MKRILMTVVMATAALSLSGQESKFFQAALTPKIALQPETTRINGISLAVWGENPQSAFALGFVNGSTGESKGLC